MWLNLKNLSDHNILLKIPRIKFLDEIEMMKATMVLNTKPELNTSSRMIAKNKFFSDYQHITLKKIILQIENNAVLFADHLRLLAARYALPLRNNSSIVIKYIVTNSNFIPPAFCVRKIKNNSITLSVVLKKDINLDDLLNKVIKHEMAHAFLLLMLGKSFQNVPDWFHEGFAHHFEDEKFPQIKPGHISMFSQDWLNNKMWLHEQGAVCFKYLVKKYGYPTITRIILMAKQNENFLSVLKKCLKIKRIQDFEENSRKFAVRIFR